MRPELESQLAPFLEVVAKAPNAVLLLDYDGTLAPFRVKRDQAYPYPGIELLLQEIVNNGKTRMVVVSGREASEIYPLLNIQPRPEVWGVHGLERLKADGSFEMPRLDERTLNGLSDADRWLTHLQARDTAEFKAGSIAIHWRGLSEIKAEDLRSRVLVGWRPIAESSGLNVLEFDGGVEIRPREADKGDAVRTFLSEISPNTPVAYLGDDNTDESAFQAMRNRGLTILVRPAWRQTSAQFWLKPPEELRDFLEMWLKNCNSEAAASELDNDARPNSATPDGNPPVPNPASTAVPGHAKQPFYFNTSAHLLRITPFKADSLGEFLAALRDCPDDSIFQHTIRTLQEHHFIDEGFSNDFAHWALHACKEPALAEELAGVDVREFTALPELRDQFVQIIEKHLQASPAQASRKVDATFYFCASDIVVMPTQVVANTVQDFAAGLREVTVHSIHHHFIEARLRLKRMSNDFSQWLQEDVALPESAHALDQIDIYTSTLEDVRKKIVGIVEKSLA